MPPTTTRSTTSTAPRAPPGPARRHAPSSSVAARAHRQGLVNRVVPSDQLDATALELAQQLAANVRAASVATKRLALRSYDVSLGRFLEEYVRAQRGCWNDRETRETLERYRAGRWGK